MTDTTHQQLLDNASAFALDTVAPGAEQWNRDGRIPDAVYKQAAELGLCRLKVPVSEGGHGLDATLMTQVLERIAAQCFATAFSFVVHNNLTGRLAQIASDGIKNQHLSGLMSGERIGAFLLTEPGVGSDATAITTRAERVDGGWKLNGEKAWISNTAVASTLSVYAQTDPEAGARGIGCFIVDASTPGVVRLPGYDLLGGHALGTGGFELHDCVVGDEAMMVAPGDGFRAAMQGIDLARINVAAMCAGMLERALDVATEYVSSRTAFGKTVSAFQGVQWMLADVATDLVAVRLLAADAARLSDAGEAVTVAAAHAKKFATRVALSRIADCMQVMGATGLSREFPLARHLAAAKMAQYLDGATEIQNVVISRALFKR